jgi:phosphate transport system substrate-binding protein
MKVIGVSASQDEGSGYIYPSAETVNDGTYPIARDLYMYTSGLPKGSIKEYLEWILSPEAQLIVTHLGFVPIIAP